MRDIKTVDYRVDSHSQLCYGFISVDSGFNQSLGVRYCSIDCRIIRRLQYKAAYCGIDAVRILINL